MIANQIFFCRGCGKGGGKESKCSLLGTEALDESSGSSALVLSATPPSTACFLSALFHLLAPSGKLDTSHLLARRGKAGRASAMALVTPGVALVPLAHDTSSRDRAAWLSSGLCCSRDRTQTQMFQLFYVRNSQGKNPQNSTISQKK